MTRIAGGQACVDVLKHAGVKTVFGLLGGSMLELYDAMRGDPAIRYIGARDERAAGHMADAYARMTDGPGIVLGAQAGPGVANLVTAVAEAHLAYSPLVVIAGAITRNDLGKDTFQEFDQLSVFQPICKRSSKKQRSGTDHQTGLEREDGSTLARSGWFWWFAGGNQSSGKIDSATGR